MVTADEARQEYAIDLVAWDELPVADALVVAVPHRALIEKPLPDYMEKSQGHGCFIDVKSKFDANALRDAGACVWRL